VFEKIKLKKELKITLIFFVTLMMFIWGINFLKGSDLFQSRRKFYAIYDNINGLTTANPVQINGYKVGLVTKIDFYGDNSGKVLVEFTIDKSIQIPKNSIAEITSDLLGSKSVQIMLGTGTLAINKDTIIGKLQQGMADQISTQIAPIKDKTEHILSSLDTILLSVKGVFNLQNQQNLANSFTNIQQTLEHLSNTMNSVDFVISGNKNKISNFIASLDEISKNIKNNNAKISNIITNFSSISDTLAKANFAQTIKSSEKAISDLQFMLDKINRGEGSLGQLAKNDTLYRNLQNSSESLNQLFKDMKAHPGRYIHFSVFGKKEKKEKKDTIK
jgi:phospholipid/cholesterol/gamma-HCH transport system substrate-binding protein